VRVSGVCIAYMGAQHMSNIDIYTHTRQLYLVSYVNFDY
jgi:hypothetical protein